MSYYDLRPTSEPTQPSQPRSVLRGILFGTLIFLLTLLLVIGLAIIGYAYFAEDVPRPGELEEARSSFQSTRFYDREGNLLYETLDPERGRRTVVPLEQISPHLIWATVATEDANFYEHPGVDPVALARALYYAVLEREFVSGASTIPQQLVKWMFLSEDGVAERNWRRKVKEAIAATEVSRTYTKNQILEFYLNEIYYGNLAYGIDAAAETYFGKDAADLTLAEAALLAGLPQLPAYYDPYTYPDRAKNRQAVVLGLMVENEFITAEEANQAWLEPLSYQPLRYEFEAPHFTLYARQQLEALLGTEALDQFGLNVTTTLDPEMQEVAQTIVREQVAALADRNVSNGALVAVVPQTGEILALVGSADFNNVEIDGQVNMALAPRQPGSSIKPLVYLAALEQQPPTPDMGAWFPAGGGESAEPANETVARDWTPGTILADIEEDFPDGANPPYRPTNYDLQEHGLVPVRSALANSYNIPAVRTLQAVGVPNFLSFVRRLGITTLTRSDYGLSLSLGGGEVPLLELTGAFAILANQGVYQPPVAIRKIEDNQGNVICEQGTEIPCSRMGETQIPVGETVVDPVNAYLITAILSDNQARAPIFGLNSALNLGNRPAAAKTGTTNDYRDSLTVGYTPQLVTGVWMGNTDNSEMDRVAGAGGAAQIWNRFMHAVLDDEPVVPFEAPPGVRSFEICADTGAQPSEACPERIQFPFDEEHPPLPPELDLWQMVPIERSTGKLATEFTPEEMIERRPFKIFPERYREWALQHEIPQPPREQTELFQTAPQVVIQQPTQGEAVQGVVTVMGSANLSAFANYELQYGISHDPGAFSPPIWGPVSTPVENGVLGQWDTTGLFDGPHTLRLVVRDQVGNEYESRVLLTVQNPPTPAPPEPTATWTPTWTPTPEPELTPTPTPTPFPLEEPTATPSPTQAVESAPTNTPTSTVAAEPAPTEEPAPEPTATPTPVPEGAVAPILPPPPPDTGGDAPPADG